MKNLAEQQPGDLLKQIVAQKTRRRKWLAESSWTEKILRIENLRERMQSLAFWKERRPLRRGVTRK